jgi:hypothetical protein
VRRWLWFGNASSSGSNFHPRPRFMPGHLKARLTLLMTLTASAEGRSFYFAMALIGFEGVPNV